MRFSKMNKPMCNTICFTKNMANNNRWNLHHIVSTILKYLPNLWRVLICSHHCGKQESTLSFHINISPTLPDDQSQSRMKSKRYHLKSRSNIWEGLADSILFWTYVWLIKWQLSKRSKMIFFTLKTIFFLLPLRSKVPEKVVYNACISKTVK